MTTRSDKPAQGDEPEGHRAEAVSAPKAEREAGEREAGELEVGGREGPEPTRFGDWELRGRCIDF